MCQKYRFGRKSTLIDQFLQNISARTITLVIVCHFEHCTLQSTVNILISQTLPDDTYIHKLIVLPELFPSAVCSITETSRLLKLKLKLNLNTEAICCLQSILVDD